MIKKRLVLLNVLTVFFIFSTTLSYSAEEAQNPNKEQISSAILKYTISGDHENGTEEFYFKNDKIYFHRKVRFSESLKNDYLSPLEETIYIQDKNEIKIFDITNKIGKKMPNFANTSSNDSEKDVNGLLREHLLFSVTNQFRPILDKVRISPSETVTFFGKKCSVIRNGFFVIYYWNDYILRKEILKPYKMVKEVTSISVNVKIPESQFFPPAYIEATSFTSEEMSQLNDSINKFLKNNTFSFAGNALDLFLNNINKKMKQ